MARTKIYKRGYSNYNYSSVAYDFEPEVYIDEEELRQEKLKKQRIIAETEKRNAMVHNIKLMATVIVFFAGCFTMMASYATVAQQRVVNSKLKEELALVKSNNTSLQADVSDSIDLDYVKTTAVERLGMTEPQSYQVVYIDVPKQSYNVQYNTEEEINEAGFSLKGIFDIFNN